MSPYNSQIYYASNNAMHTPESSPNPHSPDPSQVVVSNSRNRKLNAVNGTGNTGNVSRGSSGSSAGGGGAGGGGKHPDDVSAVTSSLPTPEMSPLELEKENYNNSLSNDKHKITFMDYNGHIKTEKSGAATPTTYSYNSSTGSSNRNMNTFDMDSIEHHIIKREYSYGNTNNSGGGGGGGGGGNSNGGSGGSGATDNKSQSNNSRSYR